MAPIMRNPSQILDVTGGQPPRTCHRLPPEIILCIAECLAGMGRTSDIATLSLLHRGLRPAVQNILWCHVTVQAYNCCRLLSNALQSLASPQRRAELASKVRTMTAILNTRPAPGERLFLAKDLIHLFTLCPTLRHITLAGGRDDGRGERLYPDILDTPRLRILTSVTSLTLTGPPGHLGPWLLLFLPRLEQLRLFGDMPPTHFTGAPPRSGASLRRVTWGLALPPVLESIQWIFAYSNEETGGSVELITAPVSHLELDGIRVYARSRGMKFQPPVAEPELVSGHV